MSSDNYNFDIPQTGASPGSIEGEKLEDALAKIDDAAPIIALARDNVTGDDVADDTVGLQGALDDVPVELFGAGTGPGRDVYLGPAVYRVSAKLSISERGGTRLIGGGRSGTDTQGAVLHMIDSDEDILELLDGGIAVENVGFRHNATVSAGTGHCIKMGSATVNCSGVMIRDCRFTAAPQDCIRMYQVGDTLIQACSFETSTCGVGIRETAGANRTVNTVLVQQCGFFALDYDVWAKYGTGVTVSGNFHFASTTGGHGLFLDGTSVLNWTITGNNAEDCNQATWLNIAQSGASGHHSVTGNTVNNVAKTGMVIDSNFNTIANNTLTTGSVATANTYDGIGVTGTRNLVQGNFLNNGWRYGINVSAGSSNTLALNTSINAATGSITTVGSAGTRQIFNDIGDGNLNLWGAPLSLDNFVEVAEIADPAAPAANKGRLYVRDNGSGKTQLVVRFPTGAIQVVATEP